MKELNVPVLIVGGGGCGLASSLFLSKLGIESLLIERHIEQSPMPKARALNRRTMEVFRQFGIADDIRARGIPRESVRKMRWATSLGGDLPTDRKTLYELDILSELDPNAAAASPCMNILYPQVRLEPLMRQAAEGLGVGRLVFGTELIGLEQDEAGVRAHVRDRASGTETLVRAQYLIAADAGKTVGPIVGSNMIGTPDLANMLTVYFRADLSQWIDGDDIMTYWLANPAGDTSAWGSGVLGKLGPHRHGRDSEEWMFHFNLRPDDPSAPSTADLVARVRALLKLPDLQLDVLGTSSWIVKGGLADRYRFGRVFLAGDAAHRHTPTTGLGLNSAIHDAHNLAWKLAMVLKGAADDALLDTYETERRPVAKRNVDWALFTFSNHALTGAAIGIIPTDPARSLANIRALFADSDDGDTRRMRLEEAMKIHRTEFAASDLDLGFRYTVGALIADGSPEPVRDPSGWRYVATGRPGHRLPHAWLTQGQDRVSSLDLVSPGVFTLFVSGASEAWRAAARSVVEGGVAVDVVEITEDGPCGDPGGQFRQLCGLSHGGAILVRPDQHVALRFVVAPSDPHADLAEAFAWIRKPFVDLDEQRRTLRPALTY